MPVSIPHPLLLIFICAGSLVSQLLQLLQLLLVLVVLVWCGDDTGSRRRAVAWILDAVPRYIIKY